jgi:CheY-like chemotaxis protein
MNALFVDDEPVARRGLRRQLGQLARVKRVGDRKSSDAEIAGSGRIAAHLPVLAQHLPDLSLMIAARDHLRAAAQMHDVRAPAIPLHVGNRSDVDEGRSPNTDERSECVKSPRDSAHRRAHEVGTAAIVNTHVVPRTFDPVDLFGLDEQETLAIPDYESLRR